MMSRLVPETTPVVNPLANSFPNEDAREFTHHWNFLKEARKKKEMSQSDLAEAIGVHVSSVRQWEYAQRRASHDHMVEIARVLGCNLEALSSSRPNIAPRAESVTSAVMREVITSASNLTVAS